MLLLGALCVLAAAPAQAQSTDNTLSSLLVEVSTDGTTFTVPEFHPAFSPTTGTIHTWVAAGHTHVRVTPTLNDSAARLEMARAGSGMSRATSGAPRTYQLVGSGSTQIQLRVIPQSGSNRVYRVNVHIAGTGRNVPAPPRNVQVAAGNAKLTLTWQAPAHWGDFPATGYEVDWYAGASVPTQETDWKRATPTLSPLPATDTSYTFTGTYGSHTVANGTAYQLRIRTLSTNPDDNADTLPGEWVVVTGTPQAPSGLSSNANLGGLSAATSTSRLGVYATLGIGTFAAGTTAYTATVPNATAWARLTPTVADTGKATVKAGKAGSLVTVSSGSPSAPIGLSVGPNALKVEVTAQNGTKKTYTVTITRQAALNGSQTGTSRSRVVWSGTLYVKALSSGALGCDNVDDAGKRCSETSVLTDDDFSYGGTNFTIKAVGGGAAAGGIFIILGTGQEWNPLRDMAVRVGSRTLTPIANIYRNPSEPAKILFPGAGASWMAGQTVSLALLEHPHGPRPGTPTLGTVTTSGTTASFTVSCVDRGWAPVTDYVLWAGKSDGTFVIQHHSPVPVNPCPTVTATMTGLEPGTAYTFKVRARNLVARYSDWSNEETATTDAMQVGSGSGDDPGAEPPGDPLTASFEQVPSQHSGTGTFALLVRLSETIGSFSRSPRPASFEVTGGRVESVTQVAGGLWRVLVRPSSSRAVSVTLAGGRDCDAAGAVCARDSRALKNTLSVTVQGPPPPLLSRCAAHLPSNAVSVSEVTGWRDEHPHLAAHVLRWNEVLAALGGTGVPAGVEPLTLATSRANERRFSPARWTRVTATLEAVEACLAAARTPDPDPPAAAPEVSIAAGPAVTEGGSAAFTLTADPAPASDLSVSVTVSQGGDVADASALGGRTVTIAAGEAQAAFTVATVDDAADEPDGSVRAALAAGSGYTVSPSKGAAAVAVADDDEAPPAIVTKRGIAQEGRDEAVVFTVRLDRAASHAVHVDWATADGAGRWAGTPPAAAGADYTAASGTLAFAAGETSKTVSVAILDDAIDEGTEYFLLRFSNPRGATLAAGERETQGLIRNSDAMPRAWLSRFAREAADHVAGAIAGRLEGSPGTSVVVGGHELAGQAGFVPRGADALDARTGEDAQASWRELDMGELLLASSFHVASAKGPGPASRWSVWGRGTRSSFEGAEGALALEGDVTTATLGLDYERERWLVGVALARSAGEGTYRMGGTCGAGCAGKAESALTGVYPYARYRVSERLSVWGALGHGQGDMTLRPEGMDSAATDVEASMAAGGARGVLLPARAAGGFELALRADWLMTSTRSDAAADMAEAGAETGRIRLALEASRAYALGGGVLTPALEVGVRNDSGDAERGSGLEAGGSVRYASGALSAELRARGLIAHSAEDYEEWGVSASVRYEPGADGRGLSMRMGTALGADTARAERLWSQAAGALAGGPDPGARLEAEVAYGLDARRGLLTPYAGVALSQDAETWRAGARWNPGPDYEVSLEASLSETGAERPEGGVLLRGSRRW